MSTISLCMIVKNEESCLANCLNSVKGLVDELIVVDTGSTDKTPDIIKEYCDTSPTFTWINDFSAARNYAFSLATKDYILWLDADDILKPEDQEKLKQLKERLDDSIDYVSMIYDITFNEKGECTLSIPRDKLIKNHKGYYWRYFVHEELVVWGNVLASDIHITHTSDHGHYSRYLANYEQRLADGFSLLPHEKYFYGGELYMAKEYKKCIPVLEEFLQNPSDNLFEQKCAREYLRYCYRYGHEQEHGIKQILSTFSHTVPTADLCYYLGNLFYDIKKLPEATFWYEHVTKLSLEKCTNDLLISSYLQLCVCYYKLNLLEKAIEANNEILELDSDNAAGLYNKKFFSSFK